MMPTSCPKCGTDRVSDVIGIGPSGTIYQWWECNHCENRWGHIAVSSRRETNQGDSDGNGRDKLEER